MKLAIGVTLLLVLMATGAHAATVIVDFTTLPVDPIFNPIGAQNINVASPSGGESGPVSGVRFLYDPAIDPANPVAPCLFNPGLLGTQFDGFCVGAQVDTLNGLTGSTEGSYTLSFASDISRLLFTFQLNSVVDPAPTVDQYSIYAAFYTSTGDPAGERFLNPDPVNCDVGFCTGVIDFSAPSFRQAVLSFAPVSEPPAAGLTSIAVFDISYDVPEPGAFLLLASGLGGLFGARWLKRARRRG